MGGAAIGSPGMVAVAIAAAAVRRPIAAISHAAAAAINLAATT